LFGAGIIAPTETVVATAFAVAVIALLGRVRGFS
jgi:hypothetical protein